MYKVRICSRHPSHKVIELPEFDKRVRVRFGSVNIHRKMDLDFNSIYAIKKTANKLAMKSVFGVNNINTPKWLPNSPESREKIANGYLGDKPIFKTSYHSRGRGMILLENMADALNILSDGYFEERQVSNREFRAHIIDGKCVYVDEKRPRERGVKTVIKNMANGYKFRRPLKEYHEDVILESIKAVEALGLDFGAADIGVNENGVWVYEVNSAPSLRTKTRKIYEEALTALIRKKLGYDNNF